MILREHNDRPSAKLTLYGVEGRAPAFRCVLGSGVDFDAAVDEDGSVSFSLPASHSFALYAYDG